MIGIIIQARISSKRLSKKVYRKISGRYLLEWVILRAKKSRLAGKVIVAIPNTKDDSVLLPIIKKNKVDFFQGSLNNVLERYFLAAKKFNIDPVVRITADCPLIDPVLIDKSIKEYLKIKKKPDYFLIEGYPFGLGDIEIISLAAVERSLKLAKEERHFEHVVSFISERPDLFKIKVKKAPLNLFRQDIRLCVDELPDLTLVKKVAEHFEPRTDFTTPEILEYLDKNPKIAKINKNIKHNYIIPRSTVWDLIIVLSGQEENILSTPKTGGRNEDRDRLETAFKIAKQVAQKRGKWPTVYYNGSDEQNDNLRKLVQKGFFKKYIPEEKLVISADLGIKNTEGQFLQMPVAILNNKRKIIIISSAYHLPRVKKYVQKYQNKFNPKKVILYPAEPKIFDMKKAKQEAEKISKYF